MPAPIIILYRNNNFDFTFIFYILVKIEIKIKINISTEDTLLIFQLTLNMSFDPSYFCYHCFSRFPR